MKKLLLIVLAALMVLSCTACSQGDIPAQNEFMQKFVTKYYGDYEITEQKSMHLDTAQIYTLKDKTDGFEYSTVVMEVFLSDLGIIKGDDKEAKTLMIDSDFYSSYFAYLANTKVNPDDAKEFMDTYADLNVNVIFPTFESTLMDAFDSVYIETALIMNELNETAVYDFVKLLREADSRNLLPNCTLAVYVDDDGQFEVNQKPTMYYDFYLDTLYEAEASDSFISLHDYLMFTGVKDPKILKWENNIFPSKLPAMSSWVCVGDDVANTAITYSVGDQTYQFHPAIGYLASSTPTNDYGIHQGTFLDIVANEKTGCPELLIGMYGTMYPDVYHSLVIYNAPIENGNDTPETPDSSTDTSEEVTE